MDVVSKTRRTSLIGFLLLALVSLAACGGDVVSEPATDEDTEAAAAADDGDDGDTASAEGERVFPEDLQRMVATGSSEGGGAYQWFVAASAIWNEHLDTQISVQSGSTGSNAVLLANNELDLGVTSLLNIHEEGVDPEDLRSVWMIYSTPLHIIASGQLDDLEAFEDLEGRRVGVSQVGHAAWHDAMAVIELAGFEEITTSSRSKAGSVRALQDGDIDAYIGLDGIGTGTPMEIFASRRGGKFLSLPPDIIDAMVERGFHAPAHIPEGSYEGQEGDSDTVATWIEIMAHKDFPEDAAYLLVKTLHENFDEFTSVYPPALEATPENLVEHTRVEIHPGVEAYLEEIGALP